MKKIIRFFLIFSIFLVFPLTSNALEKVNLYLFYGDGCPHCAKEKEFLKDVEKKYDYVNIIEYEVWYNDSNQDLLSKVKKELNCDNSYVPYTVIGTKGFTGYNENIASQIEDIIKQYKNTEARDLVGELNGTVDKSKKEEVKPKENSNVVVPMLGKVDARKVSLPILAIIIGLVDGFNPCAMWVLIFLISMLIGMKNRKKMWALGLTFLITSALVYLLFMVAWLKVAMTISQIIWVRSLIAVVAIIGAIINLQSFYKSIKQKDVGCSVTDAKQKRKTIEKIKKFTTEKSFILSMLGIMVLAFSVNLVELACSAGLPLLFTQVLSMNDLSNFEYMLYILIYIVFFLLDDLIVFFIAMFTMKVSGMSNKYSKYSHLVGGVIMLIIGVLLIVAPKILMFG